MATVLVIGSPRTRAALADDGHEVVTDGDAAYADVVVLDVSEDGAWNLLATIKSHSDPAVSATPVVAVGAEKHRLRAAVEGAIAFVADPPNSDPLLDHVRQALAGEPEPVKRRRAQQAALWELARHQERTDVGSRVGELTPKQRQLLETLRRSTSVSAAASELSMSRANVYASLHRIGRKLGVTSVPELLALVRRGGILDRR